MKSKLLGISVFAAVAISIQPAARAALVIDNNDIVAGHYVYDLNHAEMQSSTVFNNDVFSQTRVVVFQEGGGTNFVTPDPNENSGYTTASFIFKFDFSTTDYRPVSLDIYDSMFAFFHESVKETVTSSYSLDGVDFTTIHTATTVGQSGSQSASGFVNVDLSSQPTEFYYRVDFTANESSFGFGYLGAQWNRLDPGGQPFEANFTVVAVPEPATAGLLGLGILMFGRSLHRRTVNR